MTEAAAFDKMGHSNNEQQQEEKTIEGTERVNGNNLDDSTITTELDTEDLGEFEEITKE